MDDRCAVVGIEDDHDGIKLRALDLWSRPGAPAVAVPWDSKHCKHCKRRLHDIALLQADGALALAAGERTAGPSPVLGRPGAAAALVAPTNAGPVFAPLRAPCAA